MSCLSYPQIEFLTKGCDKILMSYRKKKKKTEEEEPHLKYFKVWEVSCNG